MLTRNPDTEIFIDWSLIRDNNPIVVSHKAHVAHKHHIAREEPERHADRETLMGQFALLLILTIAILLRFLS